jgi:hypothetical protein
MKVGVTLPMGNHTIGAVPAPYPTIRAMAQRAEAIGLDSIWVFDHLLFRFPGRDDAGAHESWTLLAALAAATDRIELGTLVLGLRLPGATGPGPGRNPSGALPGLTRDPEEVLAGFARAGFAHAIVWLEPMNERSLERLGTAIAHLRGGAIRI